MHLVLHFIKHFFTATRRGHGVHSPFIFQLCEEVFYNSNTFYDFEELQKVRQELLQNLNTIQIEDFGAGSKILNTKNRKIKDIAAHGVSKVHQAEMLFRLINFLKSQSIIELGTSLGLTTLYLAKANSKAKVFTIEGSKSLSEFASELAFKHDIKNIQFIHSKFDLALKQILEKNKTIDFLYIDGNHTYKATVEYFELALSKINNETVFIFDDIYWSAGMTKAWSEIKKHSLVTICIDTFYFGIIFFRKEVKEKIEIKIYLEWNL